MSLTLALVCSAAPVREARADEPQAEAPGGLDRPGIMVALMPGALSVYPQGPLFAGRYGVFVGALLRPRPGDRLAVAIGGQFEHVAYISRYDGHWSTLRLAGSVRVGRATERVFAYGIADIGLLASLETDFYDEASDSDAWPGLGVHAGGGLLGSLTRAFYLGAELTAGADLILTRGSFDPYALVHLRLLAGVLF